MVLEPEPLWLPEPVPEPVPGPVLEPELWPQPEAQRITSWPEIPMEAPEQPFVPPQPLVERAVWGARAAHPRGEGCAAR